MDNFAIHILQGMNDEATTKLVKNAAFLVFDILEGIIDIVYMQDKGKHACE